MTCHLYIATLMYFIAGNIQVNLAEENTGLRLKTQEENMFLPGQTFAETEKVVTQNFNVVKDWYKPRYPEGFSEDDLNTVCLKVVLHYFYQYTTWRSFYEEYKDCDLSFQQDDFEHPFTYDKLRYFFRLKYPNDYIRICASLTGKTSDEFRRYEADREFFNSKF